MTYMAQNEFSEISGLTEPKKILVEGWTPEVVEFALRTAIERMVKRLLQQSSDVGYAAGDSAYLNKTTSKKRERRLERRIGKWAREIPVIALYNSVPFQRSGAVFTPCRFVDDTALRDISKDTSLRLPSKEIIQEALMKILGEPQTLESVMPSLTPDSSVFSFSSDESIGYFYDRFILSRIERPDLKPEDLEAMKNIRWCEIDGDENVITWKDFPHRRNWPNRERWHITPYGINPQSTLWLLTIPEARPFSLKLLLEGFRKKIEKITR